MARALLGVGCRDVRILERRTAGEASFVERDYREFVALHRAGELPKSGLHGFDDTRAPSGSKS